MSRFLMLVILGVEFVALKNAGDLMAFSFEVYDTIGPLYCQQGGMNSLQCMTCESLSQSISYNFLFSIPHARNISIHKDVVELFVE